MGLAIDTVLVSAVNPGAAGTVGTIAPSGDTLSVRNFGGTDSAYLENIIRMGTTAGFVQVQSPLLHDNVFGIRITPAESPSVYSLPAELTQSLQAQDTLQVTISGGAAETDIALLSLFYTNLPGVQARLHSRGDIAGNLKYIKPIRIAVTSSATIGAWVDTVLTTTENLLHANKDYAVLGYMSNAALGAIGIKGIDTGNLRAAGPGSTSEFVTSDYFALMSDRTGRPHIPVFNAANVNGTFVSVCAATASVAAVVELICAELVTNLSN
jgi:hypothetical protein